MSLTEHQKELFDQIKFASVKHDVNKFIYKSEWLGYLPFGQYHWIEVNNIDIKVSGEIELNKELKVLEKLNYIKTLSVKYEAHEKEDVHIEYGINSHITSHCSDGTFNRWLSSLRSLF